MEFFKSRTSQNVMAGQVAGGGMVLAVLTWLRGVWQGMPGGPETDAVLAIFVLTFLVPVLSRWLAFARDPGKPGRQTGGGGFGSRGKRLTTDDTDENG